MIVTSGYLTSFLFCYLFKLNLMIWNTIAMLKLSHPFKVLQYPEETEGTRQAANLEGQAGSVLSVLDVSIPSLLIPQLVYFPTT